MRENEGLLHYWVGHFRIYNRSILSKKYSLDVYDKARGAGGRSSNKKFNKNESFDHGVQYISPKSSQFKKFINNLIIKKIVKKWLRKTYIFK